MPTTIMATYRMQERLKVFGILTQSHFEQAVAGRQIHHSKHHALGVLAAQQDRRRLAALRPHAAQRRKQQQIRLILSQQHAALRQATDGAANSAFFSLALDRASAHTGHASRRSLADASRVVRFARNNARQRCAEAAPAAVVLSIELQNNPDVAGCLVIGVAKVPRLLRSSKEVDQTEEHQSVPEHCAYTESLLSSYIHSADLPEASEQFPPLSCHLQIPEWQACVGTVAHHWFVAKASSIGVSHWPSIFRFP